MFPFDELQIPSEFIPWILPISTLLVGITLSLLVIYMGSLWLVYTKAGRGGWLIFIPIINIYGVWLLYVLKRVERQRKIHDDRFVKDHQGEFHVFHPQYSPKYSNRS